MIARIISRVNAKTNPTINPVFIFEGSLSVGVGLGSMVGVGHEDEVYGLHSIGVSPFPCIVAVAVKVDVGLGIVDSGVNIGHGN